MGQHDVIVLAPPTVWRSLFPPTVVPAVGSNHDEERRQCAENKGKRNPGAVRNEDKRHAQEGQAILQEAAGALKQSHRAIGNIGSDPVQSVIGPGIHRSPGQPHTPFYGSGS